MGLSPLILMVIRHPTNNSFRTRGARYLSGDQGRHGPNQAGGEWP
jgi:hypothetical protein